MHENLTKFFFSWIHRNSRYIAGDSSSDDSGW